MQAKAVTNGRYAIEAVKTFVPHAIYSSLILEDMSGFDLCRRLCALPELKSTVFVALTGYSSADAANNARAAGFHYYLLKPVGLQKMLTPLKSIPGIEDYESTMVILERLLGYSIGDRFGTISAL